MDYNINMWRTLSVQQNENLTSIKDLGPKSNGAIPHLQNNREPVNTMQQHTHKNTAYYIGSQQGREIMDDAC